MHDPGALGVRQTTSLEPEAWSHEPAQQDAHNRNILQALIVVN